MTDAVGADLHHTSFAVHDALTWARRLRRDLGATPVAGETLPEFRYLLLWVGSATEGGMLELIEPTGPGFVQRFLEVRGEGPHHVTFTVPDLRAAVVRVRDLGLTVTGEEYDHAPWREAFVVPEPVHRTVIQLAQSDLAYPAPTELLATRERDVDTFPSSAGATDPRWWEPVWDQEPRGFATLGATRLGSSDLTRATDLFTALGARVMRAAGGLCCAWPSGRVTVSATQPAGVHSVDLTGTSGSILIGRSFLGRSWAPRP